ncbi:alanine--tRNA ligase [Patescibacteria group bacterium]|nr:alanine--tRNA ligase [Patescibacteria group bacterium]MBU2579850.1 alanine--tRNA ligase [Patescibacteria group bacterium]
MNSKEIRRRYLEFFEARGHRVIGGASLIPENDSSTLFIGSGMQPLIPYLLGEKHPSGTRLVNSQKCFRAEDMEEVGDNRHNTFFEMLGNWSLGDYFKEEQLGWLFEFLVDELGFDPSRIYVSVYGGNEEIGVPKDLESVEIWKKLFEGERIFYYGDEKNWWSRSGVPVKMPVGEPGGPDSELFYDLGAHLKRHENSVWKNQPCHINCDCGRFIEVGNSVFMEYIKTEKGFEKLKQRNVDFGGGLERMAMVAQGKDNVFETDLFVNILNKIEELSGGKKYRDNMKSFEVIADHIKAAVFIIGDTRGVLPSNLGQGYVVRRLIRRAIRYGRLLGIDGGDWMKKLAAVVLDDYKDVYPELDKKREFVIKNIVEEEEKFSRTIERGLKEFEKVAGGKISGMDAFNLYQSYGFPIEMTRELAEEKGLEVDENGFGEELKKHQELSRTASAGEFKGGLADAGEETKKLHTAAHLLLAALRKVLGEGVEQKGSNITAERLRFDFSYSDKMTDEQKKEVEDLVNEAIKKDLPVVCEEMSLEEAKKSGAVGVFESKYGEKVKVYKIGDFSKEICGGPHIERTGELGGFKIAKEQSSSAGVRRIKAVLK